MRSALPYLIGIIIIVVLGVLISSSKKNAVRQMDERITLRQKDKIPYGTSVAKSLLPSLFSNADVYFDSREPGNWNSLNISSYNQAVILVARDFSATETELSQLLNFAQQGNYVMIISRSFSEAASRFFNFSYNQNVFEGVANLPQDSLRLKLQAPYFQSEELFVYPGKKYESSFFSYDTARSVVLGRNEDNGANFIRFKTGNGRIMVHLAPLAFSNYFILHKNNIHYFQNVMSMIPSTVDRVLWNEYYLNKPNLNQKENESSWFRVLLGVPAFKWGLLTGIGMLALIAFLGSRRRQRKIPIRERAKNDSLDFVKTIGRLYHDRNDHLNLAKKMGVYFLEHVRSVYKLPTHTRDESFMQALHFKSNYPADELDSILSFISYLENASAVSETELAKFHRQLEKFYQNT